MNVIAKKEKGVVFNDIVAGETLRKFEKGYVFLRIGDSNKACSLFDGSLVSISPETYVYPVKGFFVEE